MKQKILIVEDELLVALGLKLSLEKGGYHITGIANSVAKAMESIRKEVPGLVLLDISLKGDLSGIDLAEKLTARNIAFIYLSANLQDATLEKAKLTRPYGFLIKPIREKEVLIAIDVAFYRHQHFLDSKLQKEEALTLALGGIVNESIGRNEKLMLLAAKLQPYLPFDYMNITIGETGEFQNDQNIGFLRIGFNEYQPIGRNEIQNIARISAVKLDHLSDYRPEIPGAMFANDNDFLRLCNEQPITNLLAETFQLQSVFTLPLRRSDAEPLKITFYSKRPGCYCEDHITLSGFLQRALLSVLETIMAKPGKATPMLNPIPQAAKPKAKTDAFRGFIGKSTQMLTVMDNIAVVAPTETSVLILGESGTGKEAIAKSIHTLSQRRDHPLITVNCASLPATLIESELFGHEKGAFTGASEKRSGKFELANGGSIFLDEIGEMPLEAQVKLLRVLQEKEVERIGGKQPIKTDVRIIAATNRNLENEVEAGRFRLDLYYRLFVFPIMVPPLRERRDDIPLLIDHFLGLFSKKFYKEEIGISTDVLTQLLEYSWPGNVRELENFLERTILLTKGSVITEIFDPRIGKNKFAIQQTGIFSKNIFDNERSLIALVLKDCQGRIKGKNGAAKILGLPPTTLYSKMKKLGIRRDQG